MSNFITFNSNKCLLKIEIIIPKTMRVGYNAKIMHAINDGCEASVCGRVYRSKLKEITNRSGTPYLKFCAYCLAQLAR